MDSGILAEKIKLSIIIPCYGDNGCDPRENLKRLLASLLKQRKSYPSTQIICIEDGSRIDMSFLDDYPVTVVHQENKGIAGARNAGLDLAAGEYITFIDDDDMIVPDYLKILHENAHDYAYVSFDWRFRNGAKSVQYTPGYRNNAVWSYIFRRDLIGDNRFDPNIDDGSEDIDFVKRVIHPKTDYHRDDPRIIYQYFFHGNTGSYLHRYLRKDEMFKNVFYVHTITAIGGIETWLYELALKYGETHDLTVVYKNIDPAQLERLSEKIRCIKYVGQHIECEKFFFSYSCDILSTVDARELIYVMHCDYRAQKLRLPFDLPKDAKILAVAQHVCDGAKEWLGIDAECAYNPITIKKPKKVLHLVSATRLTAEKGKARMKLLADALHKADIPFMWTVFTNDGMPINDPSIVFAKQRLDIIDYIADADYLVQLSDTEGYPYSVLEALTVGTPVIITDLPVLSEMHIEDGKNAIVLPLDMKDIPVERIVKGMKKFKYVPNEDPYGEILAAGKNTYNEELTTYCTVKVIERYYDMLMERETKLGEEFKVTVRRARKLTEMHLVKVVEDAAAVG